VKRAKLLDLRRHGIKKTKSHNEFGYPDEPKILTNLTLTNLTPTNLRF
jgi:hypothetical protein